MFQLPELEFTVRLTKLSIHKKKTTTNPLEKNNKK